MNTLFILESSVHQTFVVSSHSPQKVFNWWCRLFIIYQIKNCRFVNWHSGRSRCREMMKCWHVYSCCQEINFPYVAVWQTCILKMDWMKLLLPSFPLYLFPAVRSLCACKLSLLLQWCIFTDMLEVKWKCSFRVQSPS